MGAYLGREIIIEVDATPIAAMTTKSFEVNNELVDISSDSSGDWVEKLSRLVGSKQCSISGSGVMVNDVLLTKSFDSDPSLALAFKFPTGLAGTTAGPIISGTFLIASFSVTGENADKHTFDVSFEAAAQPTLTDAV